MRRGLAVGLILAGLSSPAVATEWVTCSDPTGAASFDFLAGGADVLSVAAVTISAGDRVWASDVANGPGDPVQVGQSFEDGSMVLLDAVDGGALVAQLRLWKASEGVEPPVYAGTLRIPQIGAWAVSCSGG